MSIVPFPYAFFTNFFVSWDECKEVTSMANVHGIEFSSNQSEPVKDLIRELLKDGNCAVYALPYMRPNGELRMACPPPAPSPRHQRGVFLRIRPGVNGAVVIRPM